jgi:hypothetical protein
MINTKDLSEKQAARIEGQKRKQENTAKQHADGGLNKHAKKRWSALTEEDKDDLLKLLCAKMGITFKAE